MATANKFVMVKSRQTPTFEVKTDLRPLPARSAPELSAQAEPSLDVGKDDVTELKTSELRARSRRSRNRAIARGVPDLPPVIEVAMALPFRLRYVLGSTVAYANAAAVTRGGMGVGIGGIATSSSSVVAWASSFRLTKITAWCSAGGDFGIVSQTSAASAEQALQKDSEKISVLPTGITVPSGGRMFRFPPTTFLGMWQLTAVNSTDVLFDYWGTAGTVFDVEGLFTLVGPSVVPYVASVGTSTGASVYYLSPDGNTAHNWQPQGLPTTH